MRDRPRCPVDAWLDAAHEPVAEEEREDVVPPASLVLGHVDLPDVVEVVERAEQVAIPAEGVERGEEGDAGRRAAGRATVGDLGLGALEVRQRAGGHEPRPADALDDDGDERAIREQYVPDRLANGHPDALALLVAPRDA